MECENKMNDYNYEHEYNRAKRDLEDCENKYNAAVREIKRLRGVAREYSGFYTKVKEAFDKHDWDAVKAAFDWADE